jgi:hypothetical protein
MKYFKGAAGSKNFGNLLDDCLLGTSLTMEAASTSETSVSLYEITYGNIPQNINPKSVELPLK